MTEHIGPGSRVTLHFALHLDTGETVDSTFDRQPATLVVGDGQLLPGFEAVLLGLAAGDHTTVPLAPEQAFGPHRAENLQTFPRARFGACIDLQPGLVIQFTDPGGGSLPGVVQSLAGEGVVVDFNHPLAGRTIRFEVQILAVAPPPPA